MKNPFKFYTGKGLNKENQRVTKEIIQEIKNFKSKIRGILANAEGIGATDTQSREEIINYLKREIERGDFL